MWARASCTNRCAILVILVKSRYFFDLGIGIGIEIPRYLISAKIAKLGYFAQQK